MGAERRPPARPPRGRSEDRLASPAASAWCARRAGSGRARRARASAASARRCSAGRAVRRQRLLDRHARELVAEAHRVAARRAASPSARHSSSASELVGRERLEQPRARPATARSRRPRAAPAPARPSRASAGQHGVAHGRRDRLAGGGQHLGDEERVAAGPRVQRVGVEARSRRAAPTAPADSGGSAACDRAPSARQLAEHDPQRMRAIDLVVAVGDHAPARQVARCGGRANRRTSSVASSAQCRSSSTRIAGGRRACASPRGREQLAGAAPSSTGPRKLAADARRRCRAAGRAAAA